MSHDAVNSHVTKLTQRRDELAQLIETNSEPAHPGIDFYVNVCYNTRIRGGLVQRLDHLETIDHRR